MATKRQIEAYERRLAKIEDARQLTTECVGAVLEAWADPGCTTAVQGTLVSFTQRLGIGLLGERLITDVVICTACAHRPPVRGCEDADRVELVDVIITEVVRNGSREAVASA